MIGRTRWAAGVVAGSSMAAVLVNSPQSASGASGAVTGVGAQTSPGSVASASASPAADAVSVAPESAGGLPDRARPVALPPASVVNVRPNDASERSKTRPVVQADDRTEVVDNGDGTRTARIAVAPRSFDKGSGRTPVDTGLSQKAGRFESNAVAEPVSIAGSSGAADLVTVGRAGRQVRIGRPNTSGVEDPVEAAKRPSVSRAVKTWGDYSRGGEGSSRVP